MPLVGLGRGLEPVIKNPYARWASLPEVVNFDRSMKIADLSPATRAGIGEQFAAQPKESPVIRDYMFSVDDLPQTGLDRDLELRWDGAKRLGRRVAMQYLGPGEEKVTLKGTIYPPRLGSFEMLEALRNDALSGSPRSFVTGYGRYMGTWVIKSVKDVQTHYLPGGYPRKVEFTIELVHYGNDGFGVGALFAGGLSLITDALG